MKSKPFFLPPLKPDIQSQITDQVNLKNEFFGKVLFESNLYNLVTGNLEILDTIENKWFIDELFSYSLKTYDPNIVRALKKIASSGRFDESVRQRASEISELIDEENTSPEKKKDIIADSQEERMFYGRGTLAGIRYPQTSEVLRLMRDKSPEVKRLALWLIGKFRMTDLTQEVCECLSIRGTEEDAFAVLLTLDREVIPELKRYYLTSAGNIVISKAIVRIFSKLCTEDCMSFLVERLWSTSRQLRELTLKALIGCGYSANNSEKERLGKMIYDIFGLLAWLLAARVSLASQEKTRLYGELEKDYLRWKEFLLHLLVLTYGASVPPSTESEESAGLEEKNVSIRNLSEIVFSDHIKDKHRNIPDAESEKKLLKRLQRYFPLLIPDYNDLLEDFINYDYNIISVWTKATAVRSVDEIRTENLGESIVALLFSPEEILSEEATRLIKRTGTELYKASSDRLVDPVKSKLDRIYSEKFDLKELVFEKVEFLKKHFGHLKEDELVILAEKLQFVKNITEEVNSIPVGSLVWIFTSNDNNPSVVVYHNDRIKLRKAVEHAGSVFGCYVIPFSAVESFCIQYPEYSQIIYRYIDNCEA